MLKFLKRIVIVITVSAVLFSTVALIGCGGKDKIVNDGKTVNLRTFKAGYGIDFIYEFKERFEKVYEKEGYKLNIITPSSDMRGNVALTDMAKDYKDNGVDLYLIGSLFPDQVGENGDYGVLAEDLEESVYNQKPINFDGKEEETTIKDKGASAFEKYLRDGNGKMYGFSWATSSAGLVVNTKKLAKYPGLKIPNTTDEMFYVFDKIYESSEQTGIRPVTFVSGTNGYVNCALNTWFAQLDSGEYEKFWTMQDNGREMKENGYEVFNRESAYALESMLSLGYHAMDLKIAARGSSTAELDQAQSLIMGNKGAVFMFNGDWMLNEVKATYEEELNDIEFVNTPLNSQLGVKLFCKAPYNLTEEKADELLSAIIEKVDSNAPVEQIVSDFSEYGLTREDALTVANARGLTFCRGVENLAYIRKDSSVKDIAALVLRMMASDDYAELFSETANSATPYSQNANLTSEYKFVRQSFALTQNVYYNFVCGRPFGLRRDLNLTAFLPNVTHLPSKMYGSGVSMYDGKGGVALDENGNRYTTDVYKNAAEKLLDSAYVYAKEGWSNILVSNGIK